MTERGNQPDELAQAVAGDRAALERLLLSHYSRLAAHVARKFPAALRGVLGEEDVLQETFVEAFRRIGSFEQQGPEAFYGWLAMIASHRLADAVKAERALKRGGGQVAGEANLDVSGRSVIALLEQLAVQDYTPSRSVARHESVWAVQVALAGLKEEYREALRLRYIEGLSLGEVAARMGRTERAVDNLCDRGRKRLRAALGRASQYLTRK